MNDSEEPVALDPATLRRAPRYGRFTFAGALVAAVLAVVAVLLPVGASELDTGTLLGLVLIGFVPVGVLAGLALAVALDRRSARAADRRARLCDDGPRGARRRPSDP